MVFYLLKFFKRILLENRFFLFRNLSIPYFSCKIYIRSAICLVFKWVGSQSLASSSVILSSINDVLIRSLINSIVSSVIICCHYALGHWDGAERGYPGCGRKREDLVGVGLGVLLIAYDKDLNGNVYLLANRAVA